MPRSYCCHCRNHIALLALFHLLFSVGSKMVKYSKEPSNENKCERILWGAVLEFFCNGQERGLPTRMEHLVLWHCRVCNTLVKLG